jgi:hypothetical protein
MCLVGGAAGRSPPIGKLGTERLGYGVKGATSKLYEDSVDPNDHRAILDPLSPCASSASSPLPSFCSGLELYHVVPDEPSSASMPRCIVGGPLAPPQLTSPKVLTPRG